MKNIIIAVISTFDGIEYRAKIAICDKETLWLASTRKGTQPNHNMNMAEFMLPCSYHTGNSSEDTEKSTKILIFSNPSTYVLHNNKIYRC